MAGQVVAEGVVVIDADAKGVPEKVARDIDNDKAPVERAGQGMGKSIFGGILAGYAAIGGTQAIIGFFSGAITGASDLNETLSKSSVIFGDYAPVIEQFGDNAARNFGLSKEAAIAAAAGFGDMFSQIGFTTDQAAGMSQTVVSLAADLGSFSNLDTADVADRISAAFRGEYDSLQAVIPNINAARVESEALAATGKTVASELTAQEKASAVLAIVMKDGSRAMGDFERTSDGAANKQKILTASFEDQTTKLGSALLPAWNNVLGFMTDVALPAFSWLIENMPLVGSVLGGLAVALIAVFAPAIWGAVTATWAFTTALLANPITWIIIGITALVGGIIWLATQTTFFADLWTNVTTWIGEAWTWLWDTVLNPVITAIGTAFQWLMTNVFEPLGSFVTGVVQWIGDAWNWLYNTVIMPVVIGIMVYIGVWAAIFQWLWDSIISPIISAIGTAFQWLGDNVFAPIGAVIGAVFDSIGRSFQWLYENAILPVVGFVTSAIQGWGIIFQWLHSSVISPVFSAIGQSFNWVWGNVISPVINWISGAITNVGNTIRNVFGGIGTFIGNAFQAALGVIRGPINGIISLVNSAIRGLNGLRVTIPDWVPIVGGQTWGVNLPTIPMLAKGGMITGAGSVLVGENGPEILNVGRGASVVPLTSDQKRTPVGDQNINVALTVKSEDPTLAGRQFARGLTKRLGI